MYNPRLHAGLSASPLPRVFYFLVYILGNSAGTETVRKGHPEGNSGIHYSGSLDREIPQSLEMIKTLRIGHEAQHVWYNTVAQIADKVNAGYVRKI